MTRQCVSFNKFYSERDITNLEGKIYSTTPNRWNYNVRTDGQWATLNLFEILKCSDKVQYEIKLVYATSPYTSVNPTKLWWSSIMTTFTLSQTRPRLHHRNSLQHSILIIKCGCQNGKILVPQQLSFNKNIDQAIHESQSPSWKWYTLHRLLRMLVRKFDSRNPCRHIHTYPTYPHCISDAFSLWCAHSRQTIVDKTYGDILCQHMGI